MFYVIAALDRACLFRWQPAFPGGSRSSLLGPARDPREMEASPAFSLALPALKLFTGSLFLAHKINPKLTCKSEIQLRPASPPYVSCLAPSAAFAGLHPATARPRPRWACALRLEGPPPSPSRGWFLLTCEGEAFSSPSKPRPPALLRALGALNPDYLALS